MTKMNTRQAIQNAMDIEMARDPKVFIIGEDVGRNGCSFGQFTGLPDKYGDKRVVNTPISEAVITGVGLGAAAHGLRPVVNHDFIDFLGCCFDEILNQIAKLRWMMGGQMTVPLVLNVFAGGGGGSASQHSQSLEVFYTHMPGMKVVESSNPADSKGLLASAIRDDNPVMVIHNRGLMGMEMEVPDGEYLVPIGKANVAREGTDATIVSYSRTLNHCLDAAEDLAKEGIHAEVIDLRTLVPMDKEAIFKSLEKTNRLIIAHEAIGNSGFGAEIAAVVAEEAMDLLDAPIRRVAAPFTHIPSNRDLERALYPDRVKIAEAVKAVLS
ncbi:MAG: alpha-ketoacid dehydrogenase subunit beta [Peptococcaceae bacterium]|jgi:pyruvate dehydrogenase E1 component beta subunit|nr:alpha-ketoacid dehydrogenase subunit beta [Peptococcaceae bacterium]